MINYSSEISSSMNAAKIAKSVTHVRSSVVSKMISKSLLRWIWPKIKKVLGWIRFRHIQTGQAFDEVQSELSVLIYF